MCKVIDDENLVKYLVREGRKLGISAVEYAKKFYKNTDFFKHLEKKNYFKEYYEINKEKYVENRQKHEGKFVYFLLRDNKIIYIGSTINLNSRISVHKCSGRQFNDVLFYDFTDTDLEMSDVRCIEYYFQELYKESLEEDCTVYPYDREKIKTLFKYIDEVKPKHRTFRIKDELAGAINHPKRIKDVLSKFKR